MTYQRIDITADSPETIDGPVYDAGIQAAVTTLIPELATSDDWDAWRLVPSMDAGIKDGDIGIKSPGGLSGPPGTAERWFVLRA